MRQPPARVFLVCADTLEDVQVCRLLQELLRPSERDGFLQCFQVEPGQHVEDEPLYQLSETHIAVFLLAQQLLNQPWIDSPGLLSLLEKVAARGGSVLSLLLRPCMVELSQLLPHRLLSSQALSGLSDHDRDLELKRLAQTIHRCARYLREIYGTRAEAALAPVGPASPPPASGALSAALEPLLRHGPDAREWAIEIVRRYGSLALIAAVRDFLPGLSPTELLREAGRRHHQPRIEWVEVDALGLRFELMRHPVTLDLARLALPDLPWPSGDGDQPLTQVSRDEAQTLAELLGGRLPRLEEVQGAGWSTPEGDRRAFPWSDQPDPRCSNCLERALGGSCSVHAHDGLGISAFGVEDLAGNVWEWTRSRGEAQRRRAQAVGGSYLHLQTASLWGAPTEFSPGTRLPFVGFRAVRVNKNVR